MSGGRPRTSIGAYGDIYVMTRRGRCIAETRIRDADGRLRKVTATAASQRAATARLKERLLERPSRGVNGALSPSTPFPALTQLWLADLDRRDLTETTKHGYRDHLRLHVGPALEHFTLGEITTGRVEWFLKSQAAISTSMARRSRTLLNLLFGFALRHDAVSRNPVEGTSPLPSPKRSPQALTLDQITAIRAAAASWRTEPGLPGPKSDGNVRDIIEVLLGTAMRPGEALALRSCDVTDRDRGMVVHVTGTVAYTPDAGTYRQPHPKTHASVRRIPVPDFAAEVLRRRLAVLSADESGRTIFANRDGGPLSPYNVRRTFRDFLKLAGLDETGISLRWYRRTGATVVARGMGSDAAATFLGHTSSAITEGHYIEKDLSVDLTPAEHLQRTLRPLVPDGTLLDRSAAQGEETLLRAVDEEADDAVG